jgi:hypothetical protein
MERYMIILKGCHDNTVFFMPMTEEEKNFLQKIADLSEEFSECDCMPTLKIVDTKTSN